MLISYFKNKEQSLCFDCKRRLRENVLRILDCKNERCILVSSQAPQMIDHLCEQCNNHFKEVLEFLDELEIPYQLDPYLVRGIDYYTKTVFEFVHESDDGKRQGSLGGGGRYDNLLKLIGNRDIPACGGACGVERVINLLKFKKLKIEQEQSVLVFIAQLGQEAKKKSLKITEEFRKEKIKVGESLGKDSLKSQLARADKLGARFTLIIGQKEALEGEVIIRDMVSGRQDVVKIDKVVSEVKKKLKKIK
jgi:histidyl-tRNA synthetase